MSQIDVEAGAAGVSSAGTVDNMLHSQQVARAGGPLAAGPRSAGADSNRNLAPVAGSEGTGSLLHREIDTANIADEGSTGGGGADPAQAGSLELTIPTELQGNISPEQVQIFTQYAAAMGWGNAEAQAALDYQVQNGRAAQNVFERQLTQWEGKVRADPELGGKNLGSTVATANKAMHHFDPSGTISALLKSSGHGSNPEVVRFLYNVGRALGEDRVPLAGDGQRAKLPLAERMYPNFKF